MFRIGLSDGLEKTLRAVREKLSILTDTCHYIHYICSYVVLKHRRVSCR